MRKGILISLLVVCIVVIIVAGCTGTGSGPAPVATPAIKPTPTTVSTTVSTPRPTTAAIITTMVTVITTTSAPAPEPILHRWVRQYQDNRGGIVGYEFKFYSEGSVNYKYGTATMVLSDIRIAPTIEMSGTWAKLAENKYLVKFLPGGVGSSGIIREYTLVLAHEEEGYPGIVIKDHIESSYETDAINKGRNKMVDEMYYPERAKID